MSKRVKVRPRASQADMSQRTMREFEEAQRRREAWAQQQATREQLERAARQQGWTVTQKEER